MQNQKFNTKFNRIDKSIPEIFDQKTKVSCVGYIPRHKLIKAFIAAGKRLDTIRGKYDIYDNKDIDDVDVDVTREKSFDLAQASEYMKRYDIVNVNFETSEYIDKKGVIRHWPSGKAVSTKEEVLKGSKKPSQNKQEGPDTSSRSVSGQLTPEGENMPPAGSAGKKNDTESIK